MRRFRQGVKGFKLNQNWWLLQLHYAQARKQAANHNVSACTVKPCRRTSRRWFQLEPVEIKGIPTSKKLMENIHYPIYILCTSHKIYSGDEQKLSPNSGTLDFKAEQTFSDCADTKRDLHSEGCAGASSPTPNSPHATKSKIRHAASSPIASQN